MPELPEIENLKLSLEKKIVGLTVRKPVFFREDIREAIPTKEITTLLTQQKIISLSRRSKYLLLHAKDFFLGFHLGMSGQILFTKEPDPQKKHTHFILEFEEDSYLHFVDPRRFGRIFYGQNAQRLTHPFLKDIGVEPFETKYLDQYLKKAALNKKVSAKAFLMNSKIICGIGNIYASEILFQSAVQPTRSVQNISDQEWKSISKNILRVLQKAINSGGSSIKDYLGIDEKKGGFQANFSVYGRAGQPCKKCKHQISLIRQNQRSTYFCAVCQK